MSIVHQRRFFTSSIIVVTLVLAGLAFPSILKRYSSALVVKATTPRSDRPAVPFSRLGPPQRCSACPPPMQRRIYVPAIELPEARTTEIVLNSRSPNEIEV